MPPFMPTKYYILNKGKPRNKKKIGETFNSLRNQRTKTNFKNDELAMIQKKLALFHFQYTRELLG